MLLFLIGIDTMIVANVIKVFTNNSHFFYCHISYWHNRIVCLSHKEVPVCQCTCVPSTFSHGNQWCCSGPPGITSLHVPLTGQLCYTVCLWFVLKFETQDIFSVLCLISTWEMSLKCAVQNEEKVNFGIKLQTLVGSLGKRCSTCVVTVLSNQTETPWTTFAQ